MQIPINFDKPPRKGRTATLLRCHSEDKADIDEAARIVGRSVQSFLRIAVLQTARAVLANRKEFESVRAKTRG